MYTTQVMRPAKSGKRCTFTAKPKCGISPYRQLLTLMSTIMRHEPLSIKGCINDLLQARYYPCVSSKLPMLMLVKMTVGANTDQSMLL